MSETKDDTMELFKLRKLYVAKETVTYEEYCQQQLDNMMDEMDERCFGEMAEGQFVRSH